MVKEKLLIRNIIFIGVGAFVVTLVKCSKCDWEGSVANPTDTDLYVTIENRASILNKMFELPFLKCPLCDSDISAKAIWINRSETGRILG